MTVPSKTAFQDAIAILDNEYSSSHYDALLQEVAAKAIPASQREKVVHDFATDFFRFQRSNWHDGFRRSEVNKWLVAQPAMKAIESLLFTGKRKPAGLSSSTPESRLCDWLLRLLENRPMVFRYGIPHAYLNGHQRWFAQLCSALCEYHYENGADLISTNRQRILTLEQRLFSLETEYQTLADFIGKDSFTRTRLTVRNQLVSSHVYKQLEIARRSLPELKGVSLKKEYLFIWRLIEAGRNSRLRVRSSLVFEIFALEGFENRPDSRTIERIFAKHRQQSLKSGS